MASSVLAISLLATAALAKPVERATGEWVQIPALANWDAANIYDGTGSGVDQYTMYLGNGQTSDGWPDQSQWVSFDNMWNNSKSLMGSGCGQYGVPDNSGEEIGEIWNAIQQVAQTTGVDHRFVLAIILQESSGCVRAPTSNGGVSNPGLMQDHDGSNTCYYGPGNYVDPCPQDTVTGMVSDGTAGTSSGDGLANCINEAASWNTAGGDTADFYRAARIYNTGSITDGNHLETVSAGNPCYSSDIANRLMGWIYAPSGCSLF